MLRLDFGVSWIIRKHSAKPNLNLLSSAFASCIRSLAKLSAANISYFKLKSSRSLPNFQNEFVGHFQNIPEHFMYFPVYLVGISNSKYFFIYLPFYTHTKIIVFKCAKDMEAL